MKYIILLLIYVPTLALKVQGQKIEEDKVDEFTKSKITRTSWEALSKQQYLYLYSRISRINGKDFLDLKIMSGSGLRYGSEVVAVPEGIAVMFKLDNDSIVNLNNSEHKIACEGCGAAYLSGSAGYGVTLNIHLYPELKAILSQHRVIKARVYFTDGYKEIEINEKNGQHIQKALSLLPT